MDLRKILAVNLRRIRREKGLSQEQLAHDAGVDRAHVSKIERAVTFVGIEIIGKFVDVLGVEPAEFFRSIKSRSKK